MDYCMFWRPIYDLQWESMNMCTVHEIIFEKLAELSVKLPDNSVNSIKFWVSEFFLFLARLNFVSTEFLKMRRICQCPNYYAPPKFETLVGPRP
jgi:hypothetical protein